MFKIEAIQTNRNTCTISDEDEKKILDYIKCNEGNFYFMSAKEKIIQAIEDLYDNGDIKLYKDYTEIKSTQEIKWSEFEERTAEEMFITQETIYTISDFEKLDKIFYEMFSHFSSNYKNILLSYERTSEKKREEMLRKSYVLINNFLQNGVKHIYYRSDELAIFCLMIKKDWKYLKQLKWN